MESLHISDLASEILLFIFLPLDLHQLVICRRVNKQFQEVIDNNQLLWRIFEWEQKDQESFKPALDMFDEKSHNSLEKVSIQDQFSKEADLLHLMQVLKRSKETLRVVDLKVSAVEGIESQVVELVTAGRRLRSLVVWEWGLETNRGYFPLSRLAFSNPREKPSSVGQLQLLWIDQDYTRVLDSTPLNSFISFALGGITRPEECLKLISRFSETIMHLRLGVVERSSVIEPLFCPNLKVFEGWVWNGVSSFLNAPQLQILVLEEVMRPDFEGLLPSVEEIWLRSRNEDLHVSQDWEPLLHQCPKLRILKLTEQFVLENSIVKSFVFTGALEVLEIRNKMAQDGKEVDGIKIASLQKLVLPTQLISKEELNRASKVSEEVVNIKDYPGFIEIEY